MKKMVSLLRGKFITNNKVSLLQGKLKTNGMVPVMKIGCMILLWSVAVHGMAIQLDRRSVPLYREEFINDASNITTPQLHPQDVLWQTFQIDADYLESMSIAFDYEDSARDAGKLTVRFYHNDDMIVEQPLPLAACPPKSFLEFQLGLQKCKGEELSVQIVNLSEEAAGVFSLLETRNIYEYGDYSEGYLLNNTNVEEGSILCSFKFRTGYNYYMGFTYAFWIFLASMILSYFLISRFRSTNHSCGRSLLHRPGNF